VRRPQDPVDFPYNQEEVIISNVKDSLVACRYVNHAQRRQGRQDSELITGSGPQNRNEELGAMNHRPFLVWSDWADAAWNSSTPVRRQGYGRLNRKFSKATTADFANDVTAAIDFIKSRKELAGVVRWIDRPQ